MKFATVDCWQNIFLFQVFISMFKTIFLTTKKKKPYKLFKIDANLNYFNKKLKKKKKKKRKENKVFTRNSNFRVFKDPIKAWEKISISKTWLISNERHTFLNY